MMREGHEKPISSRAAELEYSSNVQETVMKFSDRVFPILFCPTDPQHTISNVSLYSSGTYDIADTAHV